MKKLIILLLLTPKIASGLTISQLKSKLNGNIEIQQGRKKIEALKFSLKGDKRELFYPKFNLTTSANLFYPEIIGQSTWGKNFSAGISISSVIWNFQMGTTIEIDNKKIDRENLTLGKNFEEIYYEGISLLLQLKAAQEKIALRNRAVENAQKILNVAIKKYETGLVLITDVLKARANLEKAKANLVSAKNEYGKLENSIKYLLNIREEVKPEIVLKDSFNIQPLNKIIESAIKNRKEISIQKINIKTAKLTSKLVKDGNKPSVTLSASYTRTSDDLSFENENANIGINLNWPFFDSQKTKYRYLSAEKEAEISQLEIKKIENSIIKEVSDSYSDFKSARENLKNAQAYLNFANQSYTRTLKEYKAGVSDIVSLLTADSELINSEEQYITTKTNYNISYYKLLKSTGTIGGLK